MSSERDNTMRREKRERAQFWAVVLLLANGMILAIPTLSDGILTLTGGRIWIHVILGVLSLAVGILLFRVTGPDSSSS